MAIAKTEKPANRACFDSKCARKGPSGGAAALDDADRGRDGFLDGKR